jgi:hypothetical protein
MKGGAAKNPHARLQPRPTKPEYLGVGVQTLEYYTVKWATHRARRPLKPCYVLSLKKRSGELAGGLSKSRQGPDGLWRVPLTIKLDDLRLQVHCCCKVPPVVNPSFTPPHSVIHSTNMY